MMNSLRIPILCIIAVSLLAPGLVWGSLPDFTSLVAESSPAVVNITATREAKVPPSQFNQDEVPEMFKRFFRD